MQDDLIQPHVEFYNKCGISVDRKLPFLHMLPKFDKNILDRCHIAAGKILSTKN